MTESLESNSLIEYVDEHLNVYSVDKKDILGKGGQGVVYRTLNNNIAIKIALKNSEEITAPDEIESFKESIKRLKMLQLPELLKISMPIEILRNKAGYVMRLLNSAVSFEMFLPSAVELKNLSEKKEVNDENVTYNEENHIYSFPRSSAPLTKYALSGGERLRFDALYHAATKLSFLHGRGLVYGDISAKNFFIIANDNLNSTVWFIDPDNIDYEKKSNARLYSPGYGAPELVQNQDGIRVVSDVYSFSLLSFKMLCFAHPFVGKAINDEENSWASGNDNPEDSGTLAYIDDPNDRSNAEEKNNKAFPRNVLLTPLLQKLFIRTFCQGRISPGMRPGIYNFTKAFAKAKDETLSCSHCGMTLRYDFSNKLYECKCCDRTSSNKHLIILKTYAFVDGRIWSKPVWCYVGELYFNQDSCLTIPKRVFSPFDIDSANEDCIELESRAKQSFFTMAKTHNCSLDISIGVKGISNELIPVSSYKHVFDYKYFKKINQAYFVSQNSDGVIRIVTMNIVEGESDVTD